MIELMVRAVYGFMSGFRLARYANVRRLDIQLLWASCRDLAPSLDVAKAAFALHAFHDPAWTVLGHDGIYAIIDGLS